MRQQHIPVSYWANGGRDLHRVDIPGGTFFGFTMDETFQKAHRSNPPREVWRELLKLEMRVDAIRADRGRPFLVRLDNCAQNGGV